MMMTPALPVARASCAGEESKAVTLVVDSCSTVDTSKLRGKAKGYEGVVIVGMVTGRKTTEKFWAPASEHLACTSVKPKMIISATIVFACCDGDPNPPCLVETSSILTKVTIAQPPRS